MSELVLIVFWIPFLAGIVLLFVVGALAMRQDRLGGGLVAGAALVLAIRTLLVYAGDIATIYITANADMQGDVWGVPVVLWVLLAVTVIATLSPLGRALAWIVLGIGLWRLSRGAVARWRERGAMTSE